MTGLRFLASGMIVIGHIQGKFGLPRFDTIIFGQGVSMFFVLSGFILTYSYPELATARDKWKFFLARFARIWPAYAATALLAIWIYPQPFDAWRWFSNAVLIQAWIPVALYGQSLNGPSWSISTEFAFYLLFPFLIANLRKDWWLKLAGSLALALSLIAFCYVWPIKDYADGDMGVTSAMLLYISPLPRFFEFVLGMCAALGWLRFGRYVRLGEVSGTVLEIVAVTIFFTTSYWAPYALMLLPWMQIGAGPMWFGNAGSSALPAAFLIFVLACQRGRVSRFLGNTVMVFLGETSYSVYLVHVTVVGFMLQSLPGLVALPGPLGLIVYCAVTLGTATAIWLVIERPCRAAIVKWGSLALPAAPRKPSHATIATPLPAAGGPIN
ncbi:MAG TPA: acyltransferase [Rhodopseudomonas sp.]|uniref:acyltransferase family protein n=1 Tax=Rhodopseudomonas sp. TaxID=1078 RepID=UPI002EDA72D0